MNTKALALLPAVGMTEQQFNEALAKMPLTTYIVRVAYKYDHEKEYTYSNEILLADNGDFIWETDWYEGQEDVQYIGAIAVEEIPVVRCAEIYEMVKRVDDIIDKKRPLYAITNREANLIHQALLQMQPIYAEWAQECKELAMRFEEQAEAYAWRPLKEGEKNDEKGIQKNLR